MKTYSKGSSDVESSINRMLVSYHSDLRDVSVGTLFTFDEESSEQVLKFQGYPAAAVVKITGMRDRALGIADAVITVDRAYWQFITAAQKDALIDHELEHLERVVDEESGKPKFDLLGRPKLRMRRHDRQLGWFDSVAARHGEDSMEMRQAKQLMTQTQQLYFDFAPKQEAA